MEYTNQVKSMCKVTCGAHHGCAPIPEEGKWVYAREVKDISGFTHGIGWCAPQQGACKISLNVKEGIIQEALIETIGCSGMTHSAAMAGEILVGKTILEALNTDLVCTLLILYGINSSWQVETRLVTGLKTLRRAVCGASITELPTVIASSMIFPIRALLVSGGCAPLLLVMPPVCALSIQTVR